jgi:hypothetical protein
MWLREVKDPGELASVACIAAVALEARGQWIDEGRAAGAHGGAASATFTAARTLSCR